MRQDDDPTGEIISFDPFDRARCRSLPQWVPVEAMPGLFEDVSVSLEAVNDKIPKVTEASRRRGDLKAESLMLTQLLEEMLDVAGEEIINAQLADIG